MNGSKRSEAGTNCPKRWRCAPLAYDYLGVCCPYAHARTGLHIAVVTISWARLRGAP